jgi:hypothetical protein
MQVPNIPVSRKNFEDKFFYIYYLHKKLAYLVGNIWWLAQASKFQIFTINSTQTNINPNNIYFLLMFLFKKIINLKIL